MQIVFMSKQLIYADHAATTLLSKTALEAMLPFLRTDFGNPSSLHSWGKVPRKAVAKAREVIAGCINAETDEIFFTSGGTESDNWVIKGVDGGVLVSSYEHHAVLNAAMQKARCGGKVRFLNPNTDGYITPEALSGGLESGIGLVSIMMANNEIGTINSVQKLAEVAHKNGVLFHADAVQAVGHVPIDVRKLNVDFMSASAHKFNGPKGIGFLFVRKGLTLTSLINGGQQEFGIRAGTENVASIVGMATALKENCERMEANATHLEGLVAQFYDGVTKVTNNSIPICRGVGARLPGFISIAFPGHSAEGILHLLDLKGIAISTGAACDSKNTQISHVLKAIQLPKEIAEATIRITFGPENTATEVESILSSLGKILKKG